ncbi:MAG: glycoside hydrolase family 16 protein [Bacteroidales bacterium]|jgi:beta-glucanase (GH16 family)|nr:glycoside hydrolase family 16 protein [Bacteroidales bacterium]
MRSLLFILGIFFFLILKAQDCPEFFQKDSPPINFPTNLKARTSGWEQFDAFSDDFLGYPLNQSKWTVKNNYCSANPTEVVSFASSSVDNVIVEQERLKLKAKHLSQSYLCEGRNYNYSGAYVGTVNKFQYGYIEVKCSLPTDLALNPCFWLYSYNNEISQYDEIDVFEKYILSPGPSNIQMMQNFYHNLPPYSGTSKLSWNIDFTQPISGSETIYAIEWLPEELHYYINGNLITSVRYSTAPSMYNSLESPWTCTDFIYAIPQWIQFTFAVNWTVNQNSNLSVGFEIDYIKSFKLREDNSILEFWPSYFSMNYPGMFSVHKSIRLGGNGHTAIIPPFQNITVWAKDSIILDKGFTVEGNTEFTARTIKTQPALFINSSLEN